MPKLLRTPAKMPTGSIRALGSVWRRSATRMAPQKQSAMAKVLSLSGFSWKTSQLSRVTQTGLMNISTVATDTGIRSTATL